MFQGKKTYHDDTMTDIHSCSYYCDRPACVKAQRDELREALVLRQRADAPTSADYAMGYAEGFNDACKPTPAAVPLTDEQVWNSDELMSRNGEIGVAMPVLMRLIRAIERAHGIGEKP